MKRTGAIALLFALALAGCAGGEPANPNLAAPKLVIQARPGTDEAIVFVHAAFGERVYDFIELVVDNRTTHNRTAAFSLEETIEGPGFYLSAIAGAVNEQYTLRARFDLDLHERDALVSFVNEQGTWGDAQTFSLPIERVLTRRSSE